MSEEKKKNNPTLAELLEKYKDSSVVQEIEKNVRFSSSSLIPTTELKIHPLFDESNYDISNSPLCYSIEKNGVLFPIFAIVENTNRYVINGVKRFLIAKKLKIKEVPTIILNVEKDELFAYILQNEIQNGDNAFVKGTAFKTLITKYGYTEKDICLITNQSHGQVNNLMRILSLPKEIKSSVVKGHLSYAQVRVLLGLSKEQQITLMHKFEDEDISVREAERIAGEFKKSSFYQNVQSTYERNGQTFQIKLNSPKKADEFEEIIKKFIANN